MLENKPGSRRPQLFQFCSLSTDERKQWLREILVDNRVYFRRRDQLNDPNELRPSVIVEGTNRELREFVRNRLIAKYPFKLSPAKRLLEEKRLINTFKNPQLEEKYHEILDKIGVLCTSKSSTNELLWAHYADGHRGIAIEFDSKMGLFAAAQEVKYTTQNPVINVIADDSKEVITKGMLTKSNNWSYEEEWRVIARRDDKERKEMYLQSHTVSPDEAEFIRIVDGPGHYSIPPEAICTVILGSRISYDNEAWLRALIQTLPKPPAIHRVIIERNGSISIIKHQ